MQARPVELKSNKTLSAKGKKRRKKEAIGEW